MFKGCWVALVTPFRDGALDIPALDRLVDSVIEGGVDGLVPCGTTGESPTLSVDEQLRVITAVVERSAGRVPVLAGTGTNGTASSLERSRAAVEAGADGVMLVAPYYNKPNQRGLFEHFSTIAKGVKAPIVLYNIPGRSCVEISVETITRLWERHDNIVAVKHATGSVDGASAVLAASDIAVLSGDDGLTLPLIGVGAVGVVSVIANLVPAETKALTDAALSDDWPAARSWHRRLFPITEGMLRLDTNPIPIKTALAMRGLIAEEFRLPMCPLDEARRERLEVLLAEHAALNEPVTTS
ncbi:MAG: 4-hydroxy-tetrahydrodipicolinate synthase [Planctomycetota bacterium]|nr:4-hydroxy-tetrahydrodipicolinate synthase [Planctomycetota bacterium]MCZ6816962.1 4-hydroxy-tetrahydrodipicolinate synthase [Planctomycetota bacterium]